VRFAGAAALAAAGCVGLAATASASGDPLVPSASYVRNEMPLVHTQTAARAVVYDADQPAAVALNDVLQVADTVPDPATLAAQVPALPTTTVPAPTTTTTAPPAPPTTVAAVATARKGADPNDPAVWDRLARCESGGNWAINTGNGYYGGLQFSASSWRAVGGTGLPHQASRETQIEMGKRLQARGGWSQWPACSRKLGLR
jgi:hypothetical protein